MLSFEKLINLIPKEASVLDVGAGGLEDENTGVFLKARFPNYTGINIKPLAFIQGDYNTYDFGKQFDLVVLDLNIENNLKDWSDEGLQRISRWIKPGGYLINYVMTTTEYGNPNETPQLIAEHRDKWWNGWDDMGDRLSRLKGFEFIVHQTEERRPYIKWVLLKKINGS
jgi:hypothetical protein